MSYEFYKVLHFIGIFMLVLSLGGISMHVINGGTRAFSFRRWAAITHGLGSTIAFVAGFGLIAKLQIPMPWPTWIYGKIIIWVLLSLLPAVLYRKADWARLLWWTTLVLAGLAAALATLKPL